MAVRIPRSGRSSTGAPEGDVNPTLTAVNGEKEQQQFPAAPQPTAPPLCKSESGEVLQGALQSHLNQQNHQQPHKHNTGREQLQMQVKQLQKVVYEQNTLLNFLSPGLMMSPAFQTQFQSYSLAHGPDPVSYTDGVLDCRKCVSDTAVIRAGVEQDLQSCGPQRTQCSDQTSVEAVSTEHRSLSPIKEEWSEPGEGEFAISPFGVRRKVPANPEERPICPGLKEAEKTFEDLVEEQIKLDKEFLKKDQQLRTAERRNFLRKGEGRSKTSRSNDNIQAAFKTAASTRLHRASTSSSVQNNNQNGWMKTSPQSQHSSRTAPEKRSGQENLQRNNVPLHVVRSLDLRPDKKLCPKNEEQSKQPKHLKSSQVREECGKTSGRNVAQKIHLFEERIGFKTVNDRIVRVCNLDEATTKTLTLTPEIKQLLLQSSSGGDSTSAEDNPQPPTAPYPIRRNSARKPEASDEDYASDAPSDASECPPAPRCFSAPLFSSSGSEDGSDSEPHETFSQRTPQESNAEAPPRCTRSSDLLARIFPQVKSSGKNKMDNKIWENASGTQRLVNGSELVKKRPGTFGSDMRDGARDDLMMDKMKSMQDEALNFIRSEMERFNADNVLPSDGTQRSEVTQHLNEAEDLREQIEFLRERLNRRECEWWQAHSRLQSRVEALSRENRALMSRGGAPVRPPTSSGRSAPHPDAPNLTRRHSVLEFGTSEEKNKADISFSGRDSANSRTSTASQSADDSDTTPNSENGEQDFQDFQDFFNSDMKLNTEAVIREETRSPDGKVEQLLSDGSRLVVYRNGTRKEIGADQKSITIRFFNGDVKRVLADGTAVYYYSATQTTHFTHPSGLEVLQFPNKQTEKRYPDGRREILFPDGAVKTVYSDGRQESVFPDGTVVRLANNGVKSVELMNGQREIHTSRYKQRIYPDGTIKTVYFNGKQETKYSSGKIRIKNRGRDAVRMDRK